MTRVRIELSESKKSVVAYHFLVKSRKLRYNDRRVARIGETLEAKKSKLYAFPCLCYWGMHASRTIRQAMHYAPGPVLSLVSVSGDIVEEPGDKLCGRRRTVLKMVDLTPEIMEAIRLELQRHSRLRVAKIAHSHLVKLMRGEITLRTYKKRIYNLGRHLNYGMGDEEYRLRLEMSRGVYSNFGLKSVNNMPRWRIDKFITSANKALHDPKRQIRG